MIEPVARFARRKFVNPTAPVDLTGKLGFVEKEISVALHHDEPDPRAAHLSPGRHDIPECVGPEFGHPDEVLKGIAEVDDFTDAIRRRSSQLGTHGICIVLSLADVRVGNDQSFHGFMVTQAHVQRGKVHLAEDSTFDWC